MNKSRYSILIICEGDNTEPSFFNSIRNKILNGEFDLDAAIKISPEPKTEDYSHIDDNKHKSTRKKRKLKKASTEEPIDFKGSPPLKWVKAGIEELSSGTYNEVWIVFDHDNHPTRKEAFELAESTIIDGKRVKIAFTSRSFEYFLLVNFEQLYKVFNYTDCKIANKPIYCGIKKHENDCDGNLCINGYARINGYWDNSKSVESTFPLIENKLEIGFDNASWLRYKSNIIEKDVPIYDRNPYTDIDLLISRLTGISQRIWIKLNSIFEGILISKHNNTTLQLKNQGNRTIIIVKDSFFAVEIINYSKKYFGDRIVLVPNQTIQIQIPNEFSNSDYYGLNLIEKVILFSLKEE